METRFSIVGRTLVVTIIGDIDHHSATDIKEKTDKRILQENIKNIIFDFSKVTFMDSSGIGMIIGRYKLVEKKNGKAVICAMTPEVKKIFDITGLAKIIEHYNSVDEAIDKIQ